MPGGRRGVGLSIEGDGLLSREGDPARSIEGEGDPLRLVVGEGLRSTAGDEDTEGGDTTNVSILETISSLVIGARTETEGTCYQLT